ncbi:MAG: hypothetical protein WBF67_01860, partial [Olleya sp.]
MKKSYSLYILALSLSLISCKIQNNTTVKDDVKSTITYNFDVDNLLKNIKELSSDKYEGRRTGTAGAIKAKEYIISQFQALNVLPISNTFEQSFTFETSKKY